MFASKLKTREHTLIRGVRPKKNPEIVIKTSNLIVSEKNNRKKQQHKKLRS